MPNAFGSSWHDNGIVCIERCSALCPAASALARARYGLRIRDYCVRCVRGSTSTEQLTAFRAVVDPSHRAAPSLPDSFPCLFRSGGCRQMDSSFSRTVRPCSSFLTSASACCLNARRPTHITRLDCQSVDRRVSVVLCNASQWAVLNMALDISS